MNVLSFVLFIHVVGMLGLFVALGLDNVSVFRLRRSRTQHELTPWVGLSAGLPRMYQGSLALIVISGGYLTRGVFQGLATATRLTDLGWLEASVAALVVFGMTDALSFRRMRPIWRAMASATNDATSVQFARVHDPLLSVLVLVRTVLAVAIVFLMMSRPPLQVSLVVIGVAGVAALASGGLA